MVYYYDNMRHLVCVPYSIENLHQMAKDLNIKKCWFHKNHYDIPKKRVDEISQKAIQISPRKIFEIINGRMVELADTAVSKAAAEGCESSSLSAATNHESN